MPRKRKTQSGAYAQPVSATPGQEYGKGVAEMELERAMPAPQGGTTPAVRAAQQAVAQQAPAPDPRAELAAALEAARAFAMPEQGLLDSPSARPDEPVTAGLAYGPGAGPEVLPVLRTSRTGEFLRSLGRTGNPYFQGLADRLRL